MATLAQKQAKLNAAVAGKRKDKEAERESLAKALVELTLKYPPGGKYEVLFPCRHSVTRELIMPAAPGEPPNIIDLSHLSSTQIAFLATKRKAVRLIVEGTAPTKNKKGVNK